MNSLITKGFILIGFFFMSSVSFTGCTSTQHPVYQDYDQNSEAKGAAYSADAVFIRKEYPLRPDQRRWRFYYKHCSGTGKSTYYSKTTYKCTEPY